MVLQTIPYMTTVSNQNTDYFFLLISLKLTLINTLVALGIKLVFTAPLAKMTQLLFGWDLPAKLRDKSRYTNLAEEQKITEAAQQKPELIIHHEKQE